MKNDEKVLAPVSTYAVRMLSEMAGEESPLLSRLVSLLTDALENGGTCVELSELGDPAAVGKELAALPVVGRAGDERPIILDFDRAYFHRYHYYETRVALKLRTLAETRAYVPYDADAVEKTLLSRALGIVTGGPGTGKTTLAAKLLARMAATARHPLSVALAAPTGKAAARLGESVSKVVGDCANLTIVHGTVHRLLGPRPDSVFFRHDAAHPLLFDVVVLDEASMMDLPLLEKLLDAIDVSRTRLILLGDPDQLPSIYSGSALADIVLAAEQGGPLAPCLVRLTKNHRSGENPELAALVDAVRAGDVPHVLSLFEKGGCLTLEKSPTPREMADFVKRELATDMRNLTDASDPVAALTAAAAHRVVCMLRQGPCGADAVNEAALELARVLGYAERRDRYYHGMPLIVSRNETKLNLFNGDSGVVLRRDGRLRACFAGEDGPRAVAVQNLPPCEAAYALTVHRGQGSEYGSVTLLLPPEDHPLLTRELFYTGVSRARNSVKVMASPELIAAALGRKERRASGLAERLG
jgi:exodeoxyribonuclease V alpha subunit